jgi:threonine synthase
MDATYDYGAIEVTREELAARRNGQFRFTELLPFESDVAVTLHEGDTPLIPAPRLAEELGVAAVYIKDEGRNPSGTLEDRGQALAMTAAVQHGAQDVALASTGNAGQSAAAYAARAGLDPHVFLPSRSSFVNKAMVNVHGGEMKIVEGRMGAANEAYESAMADNEEWYSLQLFDTPYRHEANKTIYYEIAEQVDWVTPDHVVYPTGSGGGLIGMYKAASELAELGFTEGIPAFWAAQSEGCAPIVDAFNEGKESHDPWEVPDTICGAIEIADPNASSWILEALRESEGGAIATSDTEIMSSTATIAQTEGVEMGVSCSAAASGAWALAEANKFDADDTVVLLNTAAGNKDADVARSHLMSQGM